MPWHQLRLAKAGARLVRRPRPSRYPFPARSRRGTQPFAQQQRSRESRLEAVAFTQEDPIGLAGGSNLYGYGGGDPINNSDPFGLCTPSPECFLQAAANWGAKRGGALGTTVLNVAAFVNGVSEATQVNALGRAIDDGDAGAAAGALAGALPVGKLGKGGALIRDALDNPGNWKVVGAFAEAATNRRARGGVSIQTIVQNADGDQLVRHTVVNRAGDVIDDHFRPMFKP